MFGRVVNMPLDNLIFPAWLITLTHVILTELLGSLINNLISISLLAPFLTTFIVVERTKYIWKNHPSKCRKYF